LRVSTPLTHGYASNAVSGGAIQPSRLNIAPRQTEFASKRKEPPGNGTALSSGRIVPTEAKPSELSGCIVGAGGSSVKGKCLLK
jgi:hypothetical protein